MLQELANVGMAVSVWVVSHTAATLVRLSMRRGWTPSRTLRMTWACIWTTRRTICSARLSPRVASPFVVLAFRRAVMRFGMILHLFTLYISSLSCMTCQCGCHDGLPLLYQRLGRRNWKYICLGMVWNGTSIHGIYIGAFTRYLAWVHAVLLRNTP